MGWLPLSLEGFLRPRRKAHCHSAARGAGLADGPERERHARDEGVARVRGQRGVGGGVGRHGPVAQRGRVDVRVEAWGERRVGRLLHRARDHQLEQAANTRTRVRCAAAGRACPLVDVLRPGRTEGLDRRWPRASARRGTSCRSRACTFPGMEICEHALHGGGLWLGNSGRRSDLEVAGLRRRPPPPRPPPAERILGHRIGETTRRRWRRGGEKAAEEGSARGLQSPGALGTASVSVAWGLPHVAQPQVYT